jgi:hypothetical protein
MMNARCGASTGLRCPPILPGATGPVAADFNGDGPVLQTKIDLAGAQTAKHARMGLNRAPVGAGLERTDHCAGVLKTRPVANYTRCPRSRCQPPSGRFQNWCGGQRRRILTVGHFGVADHDKEGEESPV